LTECNSSDPQGFVGPDILFEPSGLFHDIQMARVFPDSKTFPDSHPQYPVDKINDEYAREKHADPTFAVDPARLGKFFDNNFRLPKIVGETYQPDPTRGISNHLHQMWDVLTYCTPDDHDSLIGLGDNNYIKPGGRYREGYLNHDGPAATLGLAVEGRYDLIESQLNATAHLHRRVGRNINGNRTYYTDRMQRPLAFTSVDILAQFKDREETLRRYKWLLKSEFASWTEGAELLSESNPAHRNMVRMPNGKALPRYWSSRTTPSAEGYWEDVTAAREAGLLAPGVDPRRLAEFYRNIAAARGAGTDFCGDWFADGKNFYTCNTTDYVPVDLACLLKGLADLTTEACVADGDFEGALHHAKWSADIADTLNEFCLDKDAAWYFNYNWRTGERKEIWSGRTGALPLIYDIAPEQYHERMVGNFKRFEREGGLITTLDGTRENWGGESMWLLEAFWTQAGLARVKGNAGLRARAYLMTEDNRHRILDTAHRVYQDEGGITPEKYDAAKQTLWDGGEYEVQREGFAINNGPLEAIMHRTYRPHMYRAIGALARRDVQIRQSGLLVPV
jgi:alpha,alpha-trehalase